MSFSIGSPNTGMGPRGAMEAFGGQEREGAVYDPRIMSRLLSFLRPYGGKCSLLFS
jgi:hypothetical protein